MLVVVAALASPALVMANVTSKTDPKGDTKGTPDGAGFDLRSASADDLGGGGKVVHTVKSWATAKPGAVVLELKTSNVSSKPDFSAYKPRSGGPAQVVDHRGKKVAGASYAKVSGGFKLTFSLGFAGNPPSYKWRWRVYGADGTYDLLPNKGWVSHTVDYGGDEH